MLHPRRMVALAVTAAAVAALPATASAHTMSTTASVTVHASKAEKAIKRLEHAVHAGNTKVAFSALRTARSQTAAASHDARWMASHSKSDTGDVNAANALTIAGTQYTNLLDAITAMIDQVTGSVQSSMAASIDPSVAGRNQVLSVLNGLMGQVPDSVKPLLASVITALSADQSTSVGNLDEAVTGGSLPTTIEGIIQQAIATITSAITSAFTQIQAYVPMLPSPVGGPLSTVLGAVQSSIGTLVPSVLGTVSSLINMILGQLPMFSNGTPLEGATAGPGLLGGMLGGLLSGFTTPVTGGSAPAGGTSGLFGSGGIGGLLSGIFGSFGGSAQGGVGGLGGLSGLLGGLL